MNTKKFKISLAKAAFLASSLLLFGAGAAGTVAADTRFDDARDIALADAKLALSTISNLEVEVESYNGKKVYDVDFKTSSTEYDYKIDIATSKILNKKTKARKLKTQKPSKPSTTAPAKQISSTKARNIALADAKLTLSAISELEIETDFHNGKKVYDVEFKTSNTEYDYKIDMGSGQILDKKSKARKLKTQKPSQPSTAAPAELISSNQARDIAFADAKTQLSKVRDLDIEQKYKNGQEIYDIEFRIENTEYDYDIDAVSGKILERDVDQD